MTQRLDHAEPQRAALPYSDLVCLLEVLVEDDVAILAHGLQTGLLA